MATDEELVGRLADGDEAALGILLQRYERPLSHFLYRQTGGRDVDDLYQETWLRVFRSAANFDRSKRFSTWMFQIAINLARDWHRRPPPEPRDAPETAAVSEDLNRAEARLDANRLLARLPEPQRTVVILRCYHDFSEEDVALMVGCARGTVKSRLHHGLARLAALTQEEGL